MTTLAVAVVPKARPSLSELQDVDLGFLDVLERIFDRQPQADGGQVKEVSNAVVCQTPDGPAAQCDSSYPMISVTLRRERSHWRVSKVVYEQFDSGD